MSLKHDFIRNHDGFCSRCGNWEALPDTPTIKAAVERARAKGFHIVKGRLVCGACFEARPDDGDVAR